LSFVAVLLSDSRLRRSKRSFVPSTFCGAGRDEGSEAEAACCVALITAGLDPRASWKDTEQPEMQVESGHEMSCHLNTFAACIQKQRKYRTHL
jgi:hypothetical protein